MTKIKKYCEYINENAKNITWNIEKLQEEADKYETRQEFREKNILAYKSAWNKKILDELFKNHLNSGYTINPAGYWTKERLQEEADKYETREDFRKMNIKAYGSARLQKIMDELFKNHVNNGYNIKTDIKKIKEIKNKWSKEKLQEEADKYETRGDFWTYSSTAASVANDKKIMDELFKNHKNNGYSEYKKPDNYWTAERIQDEANKYKTRMEFRKNNDGAYLAAWKKKILDNIFKNHPNEGYLDKDGWKENSYTIYVYELTDFNVAYIGLSNNVKRRDREHLFSEKEKLINFCKEKDISLPEYKVLEDNLDAKNAKKKEKYWLNFYKDNGWQTLNVIKTGSLGSAVTKWSKKALQREADKYETRTEFLKGNSSAYSVASTKKLMDELFKNHPNNGYTTKQKKSGYWTIDKLQAYVDKYKTMKEFRDNDNALYVVAKNKKLLDELFKNHPNKGYMHINKSSKYRTS